MWTFLWWYIKTLIQPKCHVRPISLMIFHVECKLLYLSLDFVLHHDKFLHVPWQPCAKSGGDLFINIWFRTKQNVHKIWISTGKIHMWNGPLSHYWSCLFTVFSKIYVRFSWFILFCCRYKLILIHIRWGHFSCTEVIMVLIADFHVITAWVPLCWMYWFWIHNTLFF